MTEKEVVINAAIFAIAKMQDKGNTAYTVKDRNGSWITMSWDRVIRLLYEIEKAGETE